MKRSFIIAAIFLGVAIAIPLQAQFDRIGGGGAESHASFDDVIFTKDTLNVRYFEFDKRDTMLVFQDTFVQYFHEFDLSHIQDRAYFHLGFPGSPARRLIAVPASASGFRLGLQAYDPYRIDDHNFRYYAMKKAITTAFYTQGQTQQDGLFRLRFARNFKDRLQFSLDYTRINNQGSYSRQNGRGTNIGAGFWYHSKDQRFQIFVHHYSNIFDQENNGGIITDTLFNDDLYAERLGIPTALGSAVTRDQHKVYQITSTYKLVGKDTTRADKGLLAEYTLRFDDHRFRYSDVAPDSSYYQSLFTDQRGIRHFLQNRQISNNFSLAFRGNKPGQQFKVGIKSLINRINQEPNTFNLAEWRAHGTLNWNLAKFIKLNSTAELNLNKDYTGYLASGTLFVDLKKAGILSGSITLNSKPPSLIERSAWLSQVQVWNTDFKNTLFNHLKVDYHLPKLRLKLSGGQVLSTNQIYWNAQGLPVQESTLTTLNYLSVYKMFKLGSFHNENRVVLQATGNKDVFRVPDWHSQHSLYFSGAIFKRKMNFKTGIDIRMHAALDGLTYQPHIGQFTLDEQFDIPWYPSIDYHASFQVRFLRAFALLQNVLQPLRSDIYYQTSRYPQPDFLFRIGLSWVFIN
ncbi:MAG: hypothetical protein HKN87_15760 [Saprospiraceae bacterium]|nr:hypothetical protein [Saprospiraceae bacterium]